MENEIEEARLSDILLRPNGYTYTDLFIKSTLFWWLDFDFSKQRFVKVQGIPRVLPIFTWSFFKCPEVHELSRTFAVRMERGDVKNYSHSLCPAKGGKLRNPSGNICSASFSNTSFFGTNSIENRERHKRRIELERHKKHINGSGNDLPNLGRELGAILLIIRHSTPRTYAEKF